MFRADPATTASIGWDQVSGSDPVVFYDTVDHGTDHALYAMQQSVTRAVTYRGMDNNYARLTDLKPNTAYYFVIRDSEGTSERYWFKTCPDNPGTRLSFIVGGDSRNNRTPRQKANRLVAKLKPHAVLFGGDMTSGDTDGEWDEWMKDWQESIHSDGRIIPIVATRGNHEGSNDVVYNLFDVPSPDVYYAITFGGNLIRAYTLNTEMSIGGDQSNWLAQDLRETATSVQWKLAQYHKPIRPHVGFKTEGNAQYANWAPLFYDFGVNLVVECDAHTVKRTWPLKPSTDEGSDEGFIRDDSTGTVYIGEGCWGAPLRSNDDNKSWTRDSESFNQFNWVFIDTNKIEVRTIKVDNEENVGEVNDNDIFTAPANLDIWEPENGSLIEIKSSSTNISPLVEISRVEQESYFAEPQFITFQADASDLDGTITKVEFYVDDQLQLTDTEAPWTASLFLDNGVHSFTARAYDDGNRNSSSSLTLSAGSFVNSLEVKINDGADDVEERTSDQTIYANSSDLEIVEDGQERQIIGLRFRDVMLPPGSIIMSAHLQFKADENNSLSTSVNIYGENAGNSTPFSMEAGDLSSRNRTIETVIWNPPPWISGEEGIEQRTADLSSVVREIIEHPEWKSSNAMSFFIEGSGKRTAESFEGDSGGAARLQIKYSIGEISYPSMSINSHTNQEEVRITPGDSLYFSAEASDESSSVNEVRFYLDGMLLGSDSSSPFDQYWETDGYGIRKVTVVAENESGAETLKSIYIYLKNESLTESEILIDQGTDDAMELADGTVLLDEQEMELIEESELVGLKFNIIDINPGSVIKEAYLQFTTKAVNSENAIFFIRGEKSVGPATFSGSQEDISSRSFTLNSVRWYPPLWDTGDHSGILQRTTNIASIIQEIIDQNEWRPGQSIVLFVYGEGSRLVHTYESDPGSAPKLYVGYEQGSVLGTADNKRKNESIITVYPAVSENYINLKNKSNERFSYIILDMRGSVVTRGEIDPDSENRVTITSYDRGMYLIRFENSGSSFTKKFVKK